MKNIKLFYKFLEHINVSGDFDHLPLKDIRFIASYMTDAYVAGYKDGKHESHTTSESVIKELEKQMNSRMRIYGATLK
jgi:hypothetical protein